MNMVGSHQIMYKSNNQVKHQKGFTTLEILLVVSLLIMVGSATVTIYVTTKRKTDLNVIQNMTAHYIRRSHSFAKSGKNDSSWGINISPDGITLFKGEDYNSRDQNFDEFYKYPVKVTNSGISNITFSKITGTPSQSGTITIKDRTNDSVGLYVNSKGFVDY